jgi:hypothetical protein
MVLGPGLCYGYLVFAHFSPFLSILFFRGLAIVHVGPFLSTTYLGKPKVLAQLTNPSDSRTAAGGEDYLIEYKSNTDSPFSHL